MELFVMAKRKNTLIQAYRPNRTVTVRCKWRMVLLYEGEASIDLHDYPGVLRKIKDDPSVLEDGIVELLEENDVSLTAFNDSYIVDEHFVGENGPEIVSVKVCDELWEEVYTPWDNTRYEEEEEEELTDSESETEEQPCDDDYDESEDED